MRKTLITVILSAGVESRLSNQNTGFFVSAQNDGTKLCNTLLFKTELKRD